ncbi:tyrosine-type recombinase/integrase (plasmid) [Nitrobacter sp. NHB1]|uniref:tyrosine-type recombinase/integrase n=1 Tax=Nitrobacter sp. NHB1 TaxID=3119830 RepID=UPI002FFD9D80
MHLPSHFQLRTADPANVLASFLCSYNEYFEVARYRSKQRRYLASVVHFGQWLRAEGYAATSISEAVIVRFLSCHLPRCDCQRPVPLGLIENRAALNHLVRLLRTQGIVARPTGDEITRELAHFDTKMTEVWGLSEGTRDHRIRIIRRLLKAQFGSRSIEISLITPTAIRRFVLGDVDWSPSTVRVMGGAVRCYFRYRELLGDDIAHLLQAVPRPAYWRDTILPVGLSPDELEQLFGAFDAACRSHRRGYAIVRCLADLGLRSSEVAKLTLDDIDWQAGTVTIAAGKARRADVLPLPTATGAAIVDYLMHERPKTMCRAVFVRHVAPLGEPVGRRVVQKALHAAYRRLGWDRTRVHILRHTLASRLINAGTPMKQIADVLRHRSIVTSATYTRVDASRLSTVALPWPGDVA